MQKAFSTRPESRPFVVVMTGGIASGKSTVSDLFRQLGVPVVDTDIIARQLVEPGQPALAKIVEVFGKQCLLPDGNLDRKGMRQEVFAQPRLREQLENILHPLIAAESGRQISGLEFNYCILVIPLFTKSRQLLKPDCVLVIDAEKGTQLKRLVIRDAIDHSLAISILDAQVTRQERLELADDVIENSEGLAQLEARVARLHKKYMRLASRKNSRDSQ